MAEATKTETATSGQALGLPPPTGASSSTRRTRFAPGRAALEKLCRAYWYPLYVYVRRQGEDEESQRT